MESINIILDKSIHAQAFGIAGGSVVENEGFMTVNTLVHNSEFEKVTRLIKSFIPKDGQKLKKNQHNTITVLGTRGSGKTSFLLTIQREMSESEIGANLQILDIIDPTLIEEKGHVFLNVIAVIKELIDKKLNKAECDPQSKPAYSRKEWRSALNKLAAGLPSIDGIGNNGMDNWQDPEFVMDNGLKAVHASKELADNFDEFLRLSLAILNKKAFLVMFDDIDVDATKGWAVLETIRKYFTGERLITIISGDIHLYSHVVRQKKWLNFGKEILQYEGDILGKLPVFNDMITELESQYLQKVLQPKNRIHLPTIGSAKRYNDKKKFYIYEEVDIKILENQPEHEISSVYDRILSFFGINNSYQAKAYRDYLLELPLRTQVQFLNLFNLMSGKYDRNEDIVSFTDIFISDLYSKGVDIDTAIRSPKNINRLILKFLLKEKKLEELYQLQPITTEVSLNASLFSLNCLLSYNVQKDPYLIFDYFIKIGYIRNLVPLLNYRNADQNVYGASIEDLCNNTVILNDNVLKDVAGKIIAYLRGTINNERLSQAGSIPLFGLASSIKKEAAATVDRIDSVLEEASYVEKMLAYIPLSSNQYVYKQSSLLTYSPYLLLGAIGELIRKDQLEDLQNGFSELSQFRGYMMPDFKRGDNKEEIDNSEEDPQNFPERTDDVNIEEIFSYWVKSYPEKATISVHLLGKIATRFFFAVSNLENKGVGSSTYLGETFHAYILTFMNAVLVEDCRENANELSATLNLNNTNYSNDIFIKNINKLISSETKVAISKKLSFSQWMLACPLLLVYLEKTDLKESIKIFCGQYLYTQTDSKKKTTISEEIFKIDLRKYLDRVLIRGRNELRLESRTFRSIVKLEKNEPKRTAVEKLSIGDVKAYSEILGRLNAANFDFSRFKTDNIGTDLRNDLKSLQISRPSEHNFEKFLKFLENKNS